MNNELIHIIPVIRMLASGKNSVLASVIPDITDNGEELFKKGFTNDPKVIMELKSSDIDKTMLLKKFANWFESHNHPPSFIVIKNLGSIAIRVPSENEKPLSGKICIVTGAGQGFGAGIAESLYEKGANIVIADINDRIGSEMNELLKNKGLTNKSLFIHTDVSDPLSVQELMHQTALNFGGLDIIISNAEILYAGGLDEMTPETFRRMTEVNYYGFFHCTKYASEIMKIQTDAVPNTFCDIIQINSKSGLKGSKKNFTYAGSKFGGIGLTQSFAQELMPYRIKVNAICPGNYFEGPLWSDPDKGLFVQYLKAGKVPGAITISDVMNYYESQVPTGRGCQVADVIKAILYAIDQNYETGQAIPVTGGQIMLH